MKIDFSRKSRKSLWLTLSLMIAMTGCAEEIVFENKTSYPMKNQQTKIAIQWASTAKEVDENNKAVIYGSTLNSDNIQVLTEPGKINVNIPKQAEYFRVLAWSKGEGDPDLLTNWVDIIPNKTYTLEPGYLIPAVLMSGTGC